MISGSQSQTGLPWGNVHDVVLQLENAETGDLLLVDGQELSVPENTLWRVEGQVVFRSRNTGVSGHNQETFNARVYRDSGNAVLSTWSASGPAGTIVVSVTGSTLKVTVDAQPPSPVNFDWVALVRIVEVKQP